MKFWDLEISPSITCIKLMGGRGKLNTKDLLKKTEQAAGKTVKTEKNWEDKKAPEEVMPLFYSPDMWRTCSAARSGFFPSILKTARVGMEKKYNIALQSPRATTNQIFLSQQDSAFDKILSSLGGITWPSMIEKYGQGHAMRSWDGSKGTKVWTLFQSTEITKKLPKGRARYPWHALFKHEREESIS